METETETVARPPRFLIPDTALTLSAVAWRALSIVGSRIFYRYAGFWEERGPGIHNNLPIPPVHLRQRTGSATSIGSFLSLGERIFHDIGEGLARVGKERASFRQVYDFGCSCGRVLRWFASQPEPAALHGSDVDHEAIGWCRRHMPFASFRVNGALPPVNYDTASFDLVYAISVFTHLDEPQQFLWLEELRRIMRRGGYLLLSVLGQHVWQHLPPHQAARLDLDDKGFLFVGWDVQPGKVPVWSNTAYHNTDYINRHYRRYFNILEYIPQGVNNHQDLVILRKP